MIDNIILQFFCKCKIQKKNGYETEEYKQQKWGTMFKHNHKPI